MLVDVPESCSAVQEETFGPVVVINTVPDVDEAVRRANGTAYGLGSSVYSDRHGPEIAARLRAGGTTINAVLTFVGLSFFFVSWASHQKGARGNQNDCNSDAVRERRVSATSVWLCGRFRRTCWRSRVACCRTGEVAARCSCTGRSARRLRLKTSAVCSKSTGKVKCRLNIGRLRF